MPSREEAAALAAKLMGKPEDVSAIASLLSGAAQQIADDVDEVDGVDGSEPDDEDDDQQLPADGEGDDGADEGGDDEPDETDEPDDTGNEPEAGTYSDDDELELTIDGKKKSLTIKELKRLAAGGGAIEKRMQDATELRKAAQAEREATTRDMAEKQTALMNTIQQLEQFLFLPLVKKPDPALRRTNMQEYLLQDDAFREDQTRIEQLKGQAMQVLQSQQAASTQARNEYRAKEAETLLQKAPELGDPETAKLFQADLQRAIAHYGITQRQIESVDSHVLFLIARDAGRYQAMVNKIGNKSPSTGKVQAKLVPKVTRRLKPGSAALPLSKQADRKQVASTQAKAQASGAPQDVAAMLVARAKTRK